jgi:hypothetical protein
MSVHGPEKLFWFLLWTKHDDVLEKKGPIGENWRTNLEPFERRAKSLRKARRSKEQQQQTKRMRDISHNPLGAGYGLATNKSTEWEELEVFFRLCREEESRVYISTQSVLIHEQWFCSPLKMKGFLLFFSFLWSQQVLRAGWSAVRSAKLTRTSSCGH